MASKKAESSSILRANIYSNDKKRSCSILNGISRVLYSESIVNDTISMSILFADTGDSINGKDVLTGLPIVGEERCDIRLIDNYDNELKLTMYVNKVTPIVEENARSLIKLDLVSREFIINEKIRVNTRFDGKISDHVRKIMNDESYFSTDKDLDIEDTFNNYNFIGNNKKPFYLINWLSKKSIPNYSKAVGKSAGYFFFETSEGFKFKSIESLAKQKQKKSIIYTDTNDTREENIPSGYDIKAFEIMFDNRINVQEKLKIGAFSTRLITFDPFNCYYNVITSNYSDNEGSFNLSGKKLPTLNPEFSRFGRNKEFSRTTYCLVDKGSLPSGSGVGMSQEQLKKSKGQNFEADKILNQSIMRYNLLFSSEMTISIAGDYSLHAGDCVFVDYKEIGSDDDINKDNGGLYIISDITHYITPKETFSKLVLVRDSFGRNGNHSTSKILR